MFLHGEQISIMCVADNRGRSSEIEIFWIPLRSLSAASSQCQDNEVVNKTWSRILQLRMCAHRWQLKLKGRGNGDRCNGACHRLETAYSRPLLRHQIYNGLDYLVRGVGECRLFRLVRHNWGPYDVDI